MLERTFVHVHGVGYATERRLWGQGAEDWSRVPDLAARLSLPASRKADLLDTCHRSLIALQHREAQFFRQRLHPRDHWRAYQAFRDDAGFLDIETDGGTECDNITVVGLLHRGRLYQFVRGDNLLDLPDALEEVKLLVTFFGTGFDVPVLKRAFPRARLDQLHYDLCPCFRKLGIKGGLKSIERQFDIQRSPETRGLSGYDAVRLWRQWLWGSEDARRLLLAYNAEDVRHMVPLADLAFTMLEQAAMAPSGRKAMPSGEEWGAGHLEPAR